MIPYSNSTRLSMKGGYLEKTGVEQFKALCLILTFQPMLPEQVRDETSR